MLKDIGGLVGLFRASPTGTLQGLALLALLRTFAPLAQLLTLLVVTDQYGVQVPMAPLLGLVAFELAIAAATWVRVAKKPHVSGLELVLQAHLDISLFALVLYFTGGATNPFAPLFMLPLAISAATQRPRWVWLTALTTMAAYVVLRHHYVPLYHPEGHTQVYELHEDGMVVNYLFTAALLTFFVNRTHAALRRRERLLAKARDAQIRSDSVVALGALAAGYAHELSSPLSTVAVVVAELRREYAGDAHLLAELQLVEDQIQACKRIVSNLAGTAGQRRAEAAAGVRLDSFVESIVERARALHPGATINCALDQTVPAPQIVAEETLRQTIMNLVDNAARASPQQVDVHAGWGGGELGLVVQDQGPGLPAETLSLLGRTVDNTAGNAGKGLLLGLATLELMGGRLDLKNAPGGGARAEIRLPLRDILIDNTMGASHASQPV